MPNPACSGLATLAADATVRWPSGIVAKARHHFVPRFYLRLFSPDGSRINLFNIDRMQSITGASVRDQCYGHRLYGKNDTIEDFFGGLERRHAPLLRQLASTGALPAAGTEEHALLCIFFVLQMMRTTAAEQEAAVQTDAYLKELVRTHPEGRDLDLDRVHATVENAIVARLIHSPELAFNISDLRTLLVETTPHSPFVTSDNPAVRYNQYLEGVRGLGTTGLSLSGLQLFLPLSPTRVLIAYDDDVYRLRGNDCRVSVQATPDDVFQLNLIQATFAEAQIYFASVAESELRRLVRAAKKRRPMHATATEVYSENALPGEGRLIVQRTEIPVLPLRLSFLRLRPDAQATLPANRWGRRRGRTPREKATAMPLSRFTLLNTKRSRLST